MGKTTDKPDNAIAAGLDAPADFTVGTPTEDPTVTALREENTALTEQLLELQERYDSLTGGAEQPVWATEREDSETEHQIELLKARVQLLDTHCQVDDGSQDLPVQGDPFFFHCPDEQCRRKLQTVRRRYRRFRDFLLLVIPQGREQSLAITHLQDSMLHAICGCVMNDPNSKPEA
jgi:ribosomal protein S15P/S13E